jgi:DNA-binding SARP family transcriptional activator
VGDWHLEHRERLQRLYVDGLMQLGAAFDGADRHAKAIDVYRRVLARDELHEEALVALMRSYAATGERAQALRAYREYTDRLRDELDAEPARATIALSERIQQGSAI